MAGGLTIEEEVRKAEETFGQIIAEAKGATNPASAAPEPEGEQVTTPDKTELAASDSIPNIDNEKTKDESKYWKDRFDVVQGKLNAEVPRLHASNKELSVENKELRGQLSELSKTVERLKSRAEQDDSNASEIQNAIATIKQELGEPAAKALNALIESKTGSIARSYEEKANTIESRIEDSHKRQILTERQTYMKELKSLVPDLEKKNSDPRWLSWLMDIAPLSRGRTYQQLLDEANSSLDASSVAELFSSCPAFKNGNTSKEKPRIEDIIEHGKTKPGKTSGIEEKKIYSKSEVERFRKDVLQGRYNDREKERLALDAEYSKAFLEDRVK